MKTNRSEYFANVTMGKPVKIADSPLCKVGKNFAKQGTKVCYNKRTLWSKLKAIYGNH